MAPYGHPLHGHPVVRDLVAAARDALGTHRPGRWSWPRRCRCCGGQYPCAEARDAADLLTRLAAVA